MGLGLIKGVLIDRTDFTYNYWNPYDDAGGTIFTDVCVKDFAITNSAFDGRGLTTNTQALEIHSRGVTISGNAIHEFPHEGINLNSAADVTITNNGIFNNGLGLDFSGAGVSIWNRALNSIPRRTTQSVKLSGNEITNFSFLILYRLSSKMRKFRRRGNWSETNERYTP